VAGLIKKATSKGKGKGGQSTCELLKGRILVDLHPPYAQKKRGEGVAHGQEGVWSRLFENMVAFVFHAARGEEVRGRKKFLRVLGDS